MRYAAALLACSMIAGCAGMSKSECLHADWRTIGYEDGARGAPASAISARRQACANKAGVTPDMTAYLAGRDLGLSEYCSPANGFSIGSRGYRYDGVCAKFGEPAFLAEYHAGLQLHSLTSAVARAEGALRAAEHNLEDIRHDIASVETALIAPETSVAERIEYLAELKHLAEERGRIEQSLPGLALDLEHAEADLRSYEWQLAADFRYQTANASVNMANY